MSYTKKRTYFVFTSRENREKAIDFLLSMRVKFNYGYQANPQGLYLLDVRPQICKKNCLDLYLKDLYINAFSKFNKTQKLPA